MAQGRFQKQRHVATCHRSYRMVLVRSAGPHQRAGGVVAQERAGFPPTWYRSSLTGRLAGAGCRAGATGDWFRSRDLIPRTRDQVLSRSQIDARWSGR